MYHRRSFRQYICDESTEGLVGTGLQGAQTKSERWRLRSRRVYYGVFNKCSTSGLGCRCRRASGRYPAGGLSANVRILQFHPATLDLGERSYILGGVLQ